MKIRVFAGEFLRFVAHERMHAQQRLPVELNKARLPLRVDEAECVDAKALHHAETARNRAVGHGPHDHMRRFGRVDDKIPERIVRGGGLRQVVVRLGLHGVDKIGELDRVLNKENRNVVANDIEIPVLGIKLGGKPAHVAHGVSRAARADDRRKAHKHRRFDVRILQKACPGIRGH
ncbi:hypothetical protein SDC9_115411 [bioreactor metagenome]|uniref:Uncharacterized protein n=1 Tax=bioreactor metagenome TaxID=1076179 RepID=A0A645BTS7_9ZZZZ